MAAKATLTAKNLEALGVERLAGLLVEISTGDAALKRRLRLELASLGSPRDVASSIRKRLIAIDRSRSFVSWQTRRALIDDLETQHRAILDPLAKADPAEALDLMWRFLALANGIFERCDDSSGLVIGVFRGAVANLGRIAIMARADPHDLAERTFQALLQNDYSQYDELIAALNPALGPEGMARLKARMQEIEREPARKIPLSERRKIGWSSSGPIYADDLENASRLSAARLALTEIADAQGDADGFIAQYDATTRKVPKIAAEIASRLLAAGRLDEAWQALEAAEHRRAGWPDFAWEDARIAVQDALGRASDAQATRWSCFERALSGAHLREYLKRLADFDDVEVEQRALDYASKYKGFLDALAFFVAWPALDRASMLVLERGKELDGEHYEILSRAAEALTGRYPLAATLILRAMVDFTLGKARSSRYRHAARHLAECAGLAVLIRDFGMFAPHDAYLADLRQGHGKKVAFWSLIA